MTDRRMWWWLAPLALVVLGSLGANHGADAPAPVAAALVGAVAAGAVLLAVRAPRTAVLVDALAVAGYLAAGLANGPIFLTVPLTAFVAAQGSRPRQLLPALAAGLGLVGAGLFARVSAHDVSAVASSWQFVGLVALSCAAASVSWWLIERRAVRTETARRAATEERLRMAQELHDGVGHGLAVIAMQAGVALHVLDRDPGQARAGLEAIRETSRRSLDALRDELARIAGAQPAARRPAPGLDDLAALVERVRAGGLVVETYGDPGRVDGEIGRVVFGVVQESLTNVLRHARATRAVVEFTRTEAALELTVRDDGAALGGVAGVAAAGWGIEGMRRRVEQLGGTFGAGSDTRTAGTGFVVRARLPLVEQGGAMIRVALVDDQPLVRMALAALLAGEDDLELVGEAADGHQALALLRRTRPDVVLCDIRMPGLDGLELLARVSADPALNGVRMVMLTTFELDEYVFEALRSGAGGFLLKDAEPAALLEAIRIVADGGSLLAPSVTRRVIETFRRPGRGTPHPRLGDLTEREREILSWVATGRSNQEIAAELVISPDTVRTHVSRVMVKLHARDRAQLVVFAIESGL